MILNYFESNETDVCFDWQTLCKLTQIDYRSSEFLASYGVSSWSAHQSFMKTTVSDTFCCMVYAFIIH